MEGSQPLAYESLKTVLQYMEPNLRFKLANCAPSIASTEKTVPLKIDILEFNPYKITVNDTRYTIGSYRHYPPGVEVHPGHRKTNLKGGAPYDMDQFGLADYSSEEIVTAGDVVIKDTIDGHLRLPFTEVRRREYMNKIRVLEYLLARRLGLQAEPIRLTPELLLLYDLYKCKTSNELQDKIDKWNADLVPVYCRRNRTPSTYSSMVQFTVKCPNTMEKIFNNKNGTKLYEVQKELTARIFGNRKADVFVKLLKFRWIFEDAAQMVIRLPPDFQIKVREMWILGNVAAVCDGIQSLVHPSSYPLEGVRISDSDLRSTVHPTVCTAKKFRFRVPCTFRRGMGEFLQFHNQLMCFHLNLFTPDQHITLIRNWISRDREVGTFFISKIGEEGTITEIFEKCREELNGSGDRKWFVKVPMSNSSQINMHYKFLKKRHTWMLTIKVVAV